MSLHSPDTETTVTLHGVCYPVTLSEFVPATYTQPSEGGTVESIGLPTWEDPCEFMEWIQLQGDDEIYKSLWPSTAPEESAYVDELLGRKLVRHFEEEIREAAQQW